MISLSPPLHIKNSSIHLSGSKSISNRLLVLNEVLGLDISLNNLSTSEDTLLLVQALEQLNNKTKATLDIHHAGTDMRFLTALLSVRHGEWTLTGSARLKQRPVGALVTALRELGAEINYPGQDGFPPLLIKGKTLEGGSIEVDSSISSQFVSALLLIAPVLKKGLTLILKGNTVSRPYIDMTVSLLKAAGISVKEEDQMFSVLPSEANSSASFPAIVTIESDWSSASYWYSICALSKHAEIELHTLYKTSLQADAVLPEIYKNLGVSTTFKENSIVLSSGSSSVTRFKYDFTQCPDIAQTVAVTCLGLGIEAHLTGLKTLKIKETNRIEALKSELGKFGAQVEVTGESVFIKPGSLKNTDQIIQTFHDHRMALSFAPLCLATGAITLDDPSVIGKSYPHFWEDLKSVGFNVNLQP